MKSPMLLWRELAAECGERCAVDTHRDFKTVTARSNLEGSSFMTITLPQFAADFDEALAAERVTPIHFKSFKKWKGLPRFLGGFLELVFDRDTGILLDNPSVEAIRAIRLLSRWESKVELPCSDSRIKEAYRGYVKTDQELETSYKAIPRERLAHFSLVAARLFGDVLSGLDYLHSTGELVPKHGPGSTADRLSGNRKYDLQEWTERLNRGGFHDVDYLLPNHRYWKNLRRVSILAPGDERPTKVIHVPKTQKTPRIIAMEPTCMQYAQQAVLEALVGLFEEDPLVSEFITPRDQEPNRRLARKGSIAGTLATLDLSEASDRVSSELVADMVKKFGPNVMDCFFATRSTRALVPGHGVIRLNKYASMGSALCFVTQEMVFLTIIFVAIEEQIGRQLSRKDILSFRNRVHVFGDDIIVPTRYAESVARELEAFGLKVNARKSFWNGYFRESCGKEYWRGHDVSVVKLRRLAPATLSDTESVISWVETRNQLAFAGFDSTVEKIDNHLERILRGLYPWVREESPVLGRIDPYDRYHVTIDELDPDTLIPLVRGWKEKSSIPRISIDGEGALLKYFLKRGDLPFADRKHLERSGRPRRVRIRVGSWPV